jgi:crotonobetainyl-CoA:carnitine CoA-transferase CaiB-like acyl-CoA transferase
VITVFSESEWRHFCDVLGSPDLSTNPYFATVSARLAHADELDSLIEEWTAGRTAYEVMNAMQEAGVAAGVVQNVEDQFRRDRQLAARQFFEEIEHLKKGPVMATGIPLGLTGTPGRTTETGAAIGQDNDYVFGELLGMTSKEISEYIGIGAIETASG